MTPEEKLEICKKCPICDLENFRCNSKLLLNPETNDVSTTPKAGYIRGCGCDIKRKVMGKKHCPAGKW